VVNRNWGDWEVARRQVALCGRVLRHEGTPVADAEPCALDRMGCISSSICPVEITRSPQMRAARAGATVADACHGIRRETYEEQS
jgi:hypothetical protein